MHKEKIFFLRQIFGTYRYHHAGEELEFFCPFCRHHKRKLSINLDTNFYKCWVCGQAGKDLLYLLRHVGAPASAIQEYQEKYSYRKPHASPGEESIGFSLSLPDSFLPVYGNEKSVFGRRAFHYLVSARGIEPADILRYKIGVGISGEYQDSVIFPSFDRYGSLNLFTARFFSGAKKLPITPKGYKNTIILNEINVDWSAPVVIVESFTDLLKSVDNTIPLFGSLLPTHSYLFEQIVKNNAEVVLSLDSDATKKQIQIASELLRYGVSVRLVDLAPFKDPGEMTKAEFRVRYENARPSRKNSLLSDKLSLAQVKRRPVLGAVCGL